VIAVQSSLKSLVRGPNSCSAAEPDGPTAAGSGGLDKNDPEAPPNDPEIGAKAAAKASDGASLLSDRLAVCSTRCARFRLTGSPAAIARSHRGKASILAGAQSETPVPPKVGFET